jgi:hypothetical protein
VQVSVARRSQRHVQEPVVTLHLEYERRSARNLLQHVAEPLDTVHILAVHLVDDVAHLQCVAADV